MLSTREIKQRIRSITSIKQITRAMEMVAASRLKKVESRVVASRTYTDKMRQVLGHLSASTSSGETSSLVTKKENENAVINAVLITADKGLCGAYNNNAIQKLVKFIQGHPDKKVKIQLIGRKGYQFFSKKSDRYEIEKYYPQNVEKFDYEQVSSLASQLVSGYKDNLYGEIYVFYTKFHTVMKSFPEFIRLLPVDESAFESQEAVTGEYIFEPSSDQILNNLFPKYIETQLYQCILESLTSEYAARRVAMIAATENAGEMIDELTRVYNKARQETITKELLEVVSGAEAL